jgi:hypothetical protein
MAHQRKEYRKNLTAVGQLNVGGEIMQFNCYDVSVKGMMIEVLPGQLLSTVEDFEALLLEDDRGEIFVKELNLAGEVRVAWVRQELSYLKMGLEFENVVHHATKLWLKRRGYRKTQPFTADLFIGKDHLQVHGINRSLRGVCVRLMDHHADIKVNAPVKLSIKELDFAAVGKVAWISNEIDSILIGLQILPIK